jgi:Flp pilus assembly protein TadD
MDPVAETGPVEPDGAASCHRLGVSEFQVGNRREGIELLRRAVAVAPEMAEYHSSLAGALGQLGCHRQAEAELREALRLRPAYPEALHNLGVALEHLERFDEAAAAMKLAIGLEPSRWHVYAHLSNALRKAGRPEEAAEAARRAITLGPESHEAHSALGAALVDSGHPNEGIAAYRRAIALRPDYAEAHNNLGMALLLTGDFQQGWKEYEWRRRLPNALFRRAGRTWDGLDPFGQTLLLYGEGGLGNVIQFARYIPLLAEQGARVIVECQPELVPLLAGLRGAWKVIACGEPPPAHDAHFPLASLPFMWGTTHPTIPARVPYLSLEPLSTRWRDIVRQVPGFRVGVCWKGSQRTAHLRGRSFDPRHLLPLASVPGVSLINLQHGETPPSEVPIDTLPGLEPHSMQLSDVAAVIGHLDLVVTCDTSLAHLAGALGIPVWVALKFSACWRWMLNRENSPWYPTMRLFRQKMPGEWESVFVGMSSILAERIRRVNGCAGWSGTTQTKSAG